MTKRDLIMRISEETGLIQEDVKAVLQKSLDYIVDALEKTNRSNFVILAYLKLESGKSESVEILTSLNMM